MDYADALSKIRKATAEFSLATANYRAQIIGDTEYLAAREAYKKAEAEYDAAYIEAQFPVGLNGAA
jgi:hypothetical protein